MARLNDRHPARQILSSISYCPRSAIGTRRNCQFRDRKALWDEEGKAIRMVGSHTDLGDRRQMEEEIRQTRNFLQTIIDRIPVALFVKDARAENFGTFKLWNKASELKGAVFLFDRHFCYTIADGTRLQALGLSRQQLEGRIVWNVLPDKIAEEVVPTLMSRSRFINDIFGFWGI
ncbi:hypothetical protein [Spirulina sp. 06S082]|uniref:hypothetical protein n=1 Tax=Spirulina sp. 06S082 TaxID=3110248 RepID=UPI002B20CC85|nr:hypothetical protein [Spirulina sp. 06S082]MEA5468243.1 hypothetical protein [Spirulina sp. 06S082]